MGGFHLEAKPCTKQKKRRKGKIFTACLGSNSRWDTGPVSGPGSTGGSWCCRWGAGPAPKIRVLASALALSRIISIESPLLCTPAHLPAQNNQCSWSGVRRDQCGLVPGLIHQKPDLTGEQAALRHQRPSRQRFTALGAIVIPSSPGTLSYTQLCTSPFTAALTGFGTCS